MEGNEVDWKQLVLAVQVATFQQLLILGSGETFLLS